MAMTTGPKATVTLPSANQILITRRFAAPPALVFRAWTTPDLIRRWWAGDQGTVIGIEVDLRVGGSWRYVMTANAGFEVAFHGEYREIVQDERLVTTEIFEATPDVVAVTTATFADDDGGTLLTVLIEHDRPENRDAHLAAGMEEGLQQALDDLEEVAASLR